MTLFSTVRRWRLIFVLLSLCFLACAQEFEGQFYTAGLSIISSPPPGNLVRTGTTLNIGISLSGQGNLTSFQPGSFSGGTGYVDLQLYLVSQNANINQTISTTVLTQEVTSSVRHVNFAVSPCLKSGAYSLTLYETSRFENNPIFTITPLPITIQNDKPSNQACTNTQAVQSLPQADSPLTGSPWLENVAVAAPAAGAASAPQTSAVPPPPAPVAASPSPVGEGQETPAPTQAANTAVAPAADTTALSVSQPEVTGSFSTFTAIEVTTLVSELGGQPFTLTETVTVTTMVPISSGSNSDKGILFPVSAADTSSSHPLAVTSIAALTLLLCTLMT